MFSQEITPCWCIAEKLASWLRELLKYIICASGILMWKNLSQLTSLLMGYSKRQGGLMFESQKCQQFSSCSQAFFFFLKSKLKLSYIPFHFRLSIFLCQTKLRAETVFFFLSLSTCSETFTHTLKYNKGPSHFISSHIQSCVLLFL